MASSISFIPRFVQLKIQVKPDGSLYTHAAWDEISYTEGSMTVRDCTGKNVTTYDTSINNPVTGRAILILESTDDPFSRERAKIRHNLLITTFAPTYESAWNKKEAGRLEMDTSNTFTVTAQNPTAVV